MDIRNIALPSAGPLVIAALALILSGFQWQMFSTRSRYGWNLWGALISLGTGVYAIATFIQYNALTGTLVRLSSQAQMTSMAFILFSLGRYTGSYLRMRPVWIANAVALVEAAAVVLVWTTDLVVGRGMETVRFLLLAHPYHQAQLGPLGLPFLAFLSLMGMGLFVTWIKFRRQRQVPAILYAGAAAWLFMGLLDALSNLGVGVLSLVPTAEYGFLGFCLGALSVTARDHVVLFDLAESRLHGLEQARAAAEKARTAAEAAQAAAEQANRAKSRFLATVSHELRTPLNHVIGFTELVVSGKTGPLTSTQEEYLGDVLGSARHLLFLLNDILDVAKLESGRVSLEYGEFPTEAFLRESLGVIAEASSSRSISLQERFGDLPPTLRADRRRLMQVLFNLLGNAVKFTAKGGSIELGACAQPLEDGPGLQVSVTDSGIGIDPSEQERIFRPFEQVDNTGTRSHQGSGLGLAISRQLVELHGGRIWVESQGRGTGCTFRFEVPVSPRGSGGAGEQHTSGDNKAVLA